LILYLDTSAMVKLYAEEPASDEVQSATYEERAVVVSEIAYVEARSALARKEREGSFSTEEHDEAVEQLKHDFREVYLLRPVTGRIVARAGELRNGM
jgi:predicted nucleic acid-binding protein